MKITAFPNDLVINPKDFKDIGFVKNFRDPRSGITITGQDLILVRKNYNRLLKWIYEDYGRFENPAATITTDGGTVLEYYLDLSKVTIRQHSATVGIQARKSFGHFFDQASGLTFELLRQKNFLPDSMAVSVPYLVVPNNLEMQKALAIVTVLSLSYQLAQAAFMLADSIAAFLDAIGTGLLSAAGKLAATLIFFAAVLIAYINALNDLKNLYFPPLRNLKAYSVFDLINQGCLFLGYTLDSSLISVDLKDRYIMGKPQGIPDKSIFQLTQSEMGQSIFNKGYPTASDSTPTLDLLIQYILDDKDARAFVNDGVVQIERRSFFVSAASIEIDPTLTDQTGHEDEYTFNDDEVWGRDYRHYLTDFSDIHSSDKDEGIRVEHITEADVSLNADLFRLTGLKETTAQFSWAGRKEGLTGVEKAIKGLFGIFDIVTGVFGGASNGASSVQDRDGVMMIENQFFQNTKILHLDVVNGIGKQPADYKDKLSMDVNYNEYLLDLEVQNNNFRVQEMRIPFDDDQFTSLLTNNFVTYKPTNQVVEVVNIEWFDRKYSANIIILLPDTSAFNVKTTKLA